MATTLRTMTAILLMAGVLAASGCSSWRMTPLSLSEADMPGRELRFNEPGKSVTMTVDQVSYPVVTGHFGRHVLHADLSRTDTIEEPYTPPLSTGAKWGIALGVIGAVAVAGGMIAMTVDGLSHENLSIGSPYPANTH